MFKVNNLKRISKITNGLVSNILPVIFRIRTQKFSDLQINMFHPFDLFANDLYILMLTMSYLTTAGFQ